MGSLNANLLAQLAAAHAPPPPGWWPLASGWSMLAVLLLIAAAALAIWQRRPARRMRRAALDELRQLEISAGDDSALARGLELLLRRYAVTRFGRGPVAPLHGKQWVDFLVAHGGSALAGDAGRDFLQIAYGGKATASRSLWLSGARSFFRSRT